MKLHTISEDQHARRQKLISYYSNPQILVKMSDNNDNNITIPGSCASAKDFVVWQLKRPASTKSFPKEWEQGIYDLESVYGPYLFKIEVDSDSFIDLRPLGLGRAVVGHSGGSIPSIPDDVIENWLKTQDERTHGGYSANVLARSIKPGVIGSGVLEQEFLVNIPTKMVEIAKLVNNKIQGADVNPEIGEQFFYKLL